MDRLFFYLYRLTFTEWGIARASSCKLIVVAYPRATRGARDDVINLYAKLALDDTPTVRMEAARNLGEFAAVVEQHHLKHQIMAIFKYLKQDVEDSVRAVAVWCSSALWKLLETQDAVANILPFIVNSQQDESPQVRHMVAQQIIELYEAVGSDVPRTKLVSTYVRLLHDDEVQVHTAAASQISKFCQILSPEYLVQHVLPSVEELSSLIPEILYIKMKIALFKLERGDQKDCKNLLEEGQTTLDSMTDIDPSVYGSYYWVSSQYHKARQEFAEFYRCALLYLAYTSVESLSQSFKLDLAIDLSLSALLGDEIYNFGELLTHPIVESLIGTKDEWLYHILEAFKSGDLTGYQELCAVHQSELTAQPALLQNKTKLLEKIKVMCLMEIIFSCTAEDRTIPLSVIAERARLSVEDVEYLLMKSLSVHLIEGTIDQVEGTVHVSWVRPRVLEIPQIKSLRDRLDNWVEKVQTTLQFVEESGQVVSANIKNVLI